MFESFISKETTKSEKFRNRSYKPHTVKMTECRRKTINFNFSNISPEVFFHSQWPIGDLAFLIYKSAIVIYTLIVTAFSIRGFAYSLGPRRPWPVWLTNWSYAALTAYSVCSFIVVLHNYLFRHKSVTSTTTKSPPLYAKITWALYVVAAPMSYLVTLVFFMALFPQKKLDFIPAGDVNIHLMNSVIITLEILIGAIPICFFHIIYPILFGLVYVLFSVAYWLYDPIHNVLYQGVLDWSKPLYTIIVLCILCFCVLPAIQLIQYALFRLRKKLFSILFQNNLKD